MIKAKGYVYAIKHNKTGRIYVGSTESLKTRIGQHFQALKSNRHQSREMQTDFNDYGDDFSVYILFYGECEKSALMMMEKLFITVFRSKDPEVGYNAQDKALEVELSQFEPMTKSEALCGYYDYLRPLIEKVQTAISESEYSQAELAEKIGVSSASITQWKMGQIVPTRQNFAKLMAAVYQL